MPSCVLKSQRLNLSVLKVLNPDPEKLREDLAALLEKSGSFMNHAPVVISFTEGADDADVVLAIVDAIRSENLVPIGLSGVSEDVASRAQLTVLDVTEKLREKQQPAPTGAKIIDRPIRSGQQIYARNSDLVVHGAVGVGAEIAADGSIHVYGPLRGRAIAGAAGDRDARIYAHEFHAELIAIAGEYKVIDDPQDSLLGKAISARLIDEAMHIEPL